MFDFETVYLARHGQTEWNVEGRRQGRLDSPLTPTGLAQARRNAEDARAEPIDALFCSPMGRARTTAEVFAAALGLAAQVVEELAEVDHGRLSGLVRAQVEAGWPGFEQARARDKYFCRFPDGESYADADARAARALEAIAGSGARRPLLVSHEMIGRMLLKNLAGLSRTEALALSHPSDLVYKVRPDRREFVALSPATA
ncbi:histidine phosphatase family protein [Actinospica durhamensis]|uniref:Histidine phosphatase family protein n=1 Tax=Actinospica durhamensis TaxID=1508375 RepID=A0A941EFU2_9ACTN|nr:histidine phosphatase family protein [Actinospica durhamensis]MBR7831860.1 histidine phosphatase family protein [Actinospica durhamensis]